jgi:integrase/recombinase XerC
LSPKNGDERAVPLSDRLAATLRVAVRASFPAPCLVVDEQGRTPSRQEVLRRLKRLQRQLGLPERSFHALRHYFCTTLVRRGASLEAVRVITGHGSLSVTERYVHAIGEDLASAIGRLNS